MDSDDFKISIDLPDPNDGFRILDFIKRHFPTIPSIDSFQQTLQLPERPASATLFPPDSIHSPRAVGFFTNMENFELEIRYVKPYKTIFTRTETLSYFIMIE